MVACLAQPAGSLELLVSWLHLEAVQLLLMSWLNIQAVNMSDQVECALSSCATKYCNHIRIGLMDGNDAHVMTTSVSHATEGASACDL